ncbi:MAG: sulfurtransferase [candidate division NC10 bacterium]|nr:sulfurtransferase [candidate division NC10 bacterium]
MEITAEELKARLDSGARVTLVDVREPWEWNLCRLAEARHIPMGEIPARYLELEPEDEVVVYCHVGQRSAMVVEYLRRLGFQKAVNLRGGIEAWARQVDPTLRRY